MEMLEKLRRGFDLSYDEATMLFNAILDGTVEEKEIEEALVRLADKGETEEEIAAAAKALLEHAVSLNHDFTSLLDVVGTGGDESHSFNISTAASIVCSLFIPVAKHGNRAVSSRSGSADFLEALNIPINLDSDAASRHLSEKNFVFLFAQKFHPAMKMVAPVRKRLARRTIFNLLGPLLNPASPSAQLIGVFSKDILPRYVKAVQTLGIPNAMVVSSEDGLDEVSISDITYCMHKTNGSVKAFEFDPKAFGIYAGKDAVQGYEPEGNARIMKETLRGNHPDLVNVISINTAFALVTAGVENEIRSAFLLAKESIEGGKAYDKLMELSS
jgi:anthranilate phosphoribosyltransferase